MSFQTMEQGIQAIQGGNREEGSRLLRIALKDEQLAPQARSVALLWLAETHDDPQFKINCYQQALAIDPGNQNAQQRLSYMMAAQLPQQQETPQEPTPPPDQSAAPQPQPPNSMPGFNQPTQPQHGQPPAQQPQPPNSMPGFNQPTQPQPQPPNSMPGFNQPTNPPMGQSGIPSSAQLGPPYAIQGTQRSVGIVGGSNGEGSGIIISQDGIIATTRYVVGGEEDVKVMLANGHRLPGKVLRSFPEFDLALVKVNAMASQLMPTNNNPHIPDHTPLLAIAHNGQGQRSQKRASKHQLAQHWIPTLIEQLQDAGGDPIFDDNNLLVGMLTRNASRANGYVYGLHISKIQQLLDGYRQEVRQQADNRVYCRHCGTSSRAAAYGGFYCETCGAVLPYAENMQRFPQPNTVALYGENIHRQCPKCSSQVGYYDSKCLRCGYDITQD